MRGHTYGTIYGGWWIPDALNLNSTSIAISAGAGEDISFDLAIQSKFGCTVEIYDPTDRAQKHFEEVQNYYNPNFPGFSGNIQKDYEFWIAPLNPNFAKINFNNFGLASTDSTMKFYKQSNPDYVSQSVLPNMYGTEYTIANMKRLQTVIREKGFKQIDLLKLDIEGAELQVLESMLEDEIYPRVLCIEFDYYLKGKDIGETAEIIKKLFAVGYKLLNNANWNITFMHTSN